MATVASLAPDQRESAARPAVEAKRLRRRRLVGLGSPFTGSLLLHVLVLALMGLIVAAPPDLRRRPLAIVASAQIGEPEAEFEPLEIVPLEEVPVEEPSLASAEVEAGAIDLGDSLAMEVPTAVPADLALGPPLVDVGADLGDLGRGLADDGLGDAGATFFGRTMRGRRFVFVIDNSNSMTKGRLETAFEELLRAVEALEPKQSFYVILFSDTAYRMFHPKPAPTLVPATPENKRRLRQWLGTVEMCLKTRGEEAVRAAIAMQPDVISILGDGRFTDRATRLLTAPHDRGIVINTYGMQVDSAGRSDLTAIAEANGGAFMPVVTTPEAVSRARSRPITRNTIKGDVWGLELPPGNQK